MTIEYELPEIKAAAETFIQAVNGYKIFAFNGEMGAGKTTFIHAVCDLLKVKDVVGSPTFSLINEYRYDEGNEERSIFHIDLYRIRSVEEAIQAGIEDCFYTGEICFIEWPQKAAVLLPQGTVQVQISLLGETKRRVEIDNI